MTVILNYHGVTEEALSVVATGTEEAGTGVELRTKFLFNIFIDQLQTKFSLSISYSQEIMKPH